MQGRGRQNELAPVSVWALPQPRGEVRQGEKCGVDLFDKFSIRLRFLVDALPLRVVLKGFPIRSCGFAAGMLKDVDQRVTFLWIVEGSPIGDALQPVAIEDLDSVIAEPCFQIGKLSGGGMIHAELIHSGRGLGRT